MVHLFNAYFFPFTAQRERERREREEKRENKVGGWRIFNLLIPSLNPTIEKVGSG